MFYGNCYTIQLMILIINSWEIQYICQTFNVNCKRTLTGHLCAETRTFCICPFSTCILITGEITGNVIIIIKHTESFMHFAQ